MTKKDKIDKKFNELKEARLKSFEKRRKIHMGRGIFRADPPLNEDKLLKKATEIINKEK